MDAAREMQVSSELNALGKAMQELAGKMRVIAEWLPRILCGEDGIQHIAKDPSTLQLVSLAESMREITDCVNSQVEELDSILVASNYRISYDSVQCD